ncbi:natural killer cells antigen CD94-like [Sorex araneus]|uniref:natural killer cells antigen CD94-like n=1 Tax=Sorex araneus TaxID=42254 RepID=UPI0024337EA0|nr:natural killer cells antigen CD94-like [Sorex araneus]
MAAFRTTQWRWISGILGILCLFLMILLGILLNKPYLNQSITPTPSPGLQEDHSDSCCFCPEGWLGHQCKCYFFSIEQKSWEASRNFCESKNSSLLQLHSKDELGFVRRSRYFYWIGISYNKDRGAWFWLNGSAFSPALFKEPQAFNTKKCITYKPGEGFLDDSCEKKNSYICKQQLN